MVTAALIGAAAAAPTPAASTRLTATKPCKKGAKAARIAGKRVCLKAGQRCETKLDRQYHRAKLHCVAGRLSKEHPPPPADLSITVTALDATVAVGEEFSVTFTVTNAGPGAATGVSVSPTLPAVAEWTHMSSLSGVMPRCTGTRAAMSCGLGLGPLTSSVPVGMVITMHAPVAGTLTASATVSARTRDPNVTNNSSSATVVVSP